MYYIELQHNKEFHSILSVKDRTHFRDKRTAAKHAKEWNAALHIRRYPLNECVAIVREGLHEPLNNLKQKQTKGKWQRIRKLG